MGKKNRAKQNGKPQGGLSKGRKELLKLANELFKLGVQTPNRNEEWEYFVNLHRCVMEFEEKWKTVMPPQGGVVDRMTAMVEFKEWIEENRVVSHKIELHDFGKEFGFGLKATEDIEMKNLLVSIPKKILLSFEEAESSYLDDLIKSNEFLSVMPNVCLALYIHCERHKMDSKYKPYIDILPSSFNTVLYSSPDDLKYLKGSSCISNAINQFKSIVRQFALLFQVFNGNQPKLEVSKIPIEARETFSFDAYRWAVSVVTTRQNKVPNCLNDVDEVPSSTLALIPFWDMFNHSPGPLSTTFNVSSQSIDCFAMKDFKLGEEVTICYGARSNFDLLIHNGFVVEKNPFDKVNIKLGLSSSDPLYSKKSDLLNLLNIPPSGHFAVCAMDGNLPVSPELIAFLRVFHMNQETLDEWLNNKRNNLSRLYEVYRTSSSDDEIKVWKYLETRLKLLLKSMDVTLPQDFESLLKDESLSIHARLALRLRREEQRLLSSCVIFCEQFCESMMNRKKLEDCNDEVEKLLDENVEDLSEQIKESSLCDKTKHNKQLLENGDNLNRKEVVEKSQ